jgi:hypothetical protein
MPGEVLDEFEIAVGIIILVELLEDFIILDHFLP